MWNLLLMALVAMVIFQIIGIRAQSRRAKHLTTLMDSFNDEQKFFEIAEDAEKEEKNNEYLQKCRVIRLWGAAYYNHDEDFKETLEKVDLSALCGKGGTITINEDAFFYLYLIIPHYLYSENKQEEIDMLHEKLEAVNADDTMIKALSKANESYYLNQGDLGKEFYQKILDGDYEGYKYSKQLIGLYKNIMTAMLAAIYKKENNQEKYEEILPEVRSFMKMPMGDRWIKELGLEIEEPVEETENSEEEPKEIEENNEESNEENKENQ